MHPIGLKLTKEIYCSFEDSKTQKFESRFFVRTKLSPISNFYVSYKMFVKNMEYF